MDTNEAFESITRLHLCKAINIELGLDQEWFLDAVEDRASIGYWLYQLMALMDELEKTDIEPYQIIQTRVGVSQRTSVTPTRLERYFSHLPKTIPWRFSQEIGLMPDIYSRAFYEADMQCASLDSDNDVNFAQRCNYFCQYWRKALKDTAFKAEMQSVQQATMDRYKQCLAITDSLMKAHDSLQVCKVELTYIREKDFGLIRHAGKRIRKAFKEHFMVLIEKLYTEQYSDQLVGHIPVLYYSDLIQGSVQLILFFRGDVEINQKDVVNTIDTLWFDILIEGRGGCRGVQNHKVSFMRMGMGKLQENTMTYQNLQQSLAFYAKWPQFIKNCRDGKRDRLALPMKMITGK